MLNIAYAASKIQYSVAGLTILKLGELKYYCSKLLFETLICLKQKGETKIMLFVTTTKNSDIRIDTDSKHYTIVMPLYHTETGGVMHKEKAVLIEKLEKIIKVSLNKNCGNQKSNDATDILGYLNFKSKVLIDGAKRHIRISITLFKNRKTILKNYDIGKKKQITLKRFR